MPGKPTMTAFVLHGAKDIRKEQVPCPAPGPGEVLVAVRGIPCNRYFLSTMFSTARTSSLQRNLQWYRAPYDASLLAEVRKILAPIMDPQWNDDAGTAPLTKN